jgi:hypothetical protein
MLVVVAVWLAPLLFTALLPAFLLTPPQLRRTLSRVPRPILDAVVLGEIGVVQFVAVHVEPRLIAPFALMAGLGVVWWRLVPQAAPGKAAPAPQPPRPRARTRGWLSCAGLGAAATLAIATLWEHGLTNRRIGHRQGEISQLRGTQPTGKRGARILVIGASLPLLTDVWRIGGRIVAQVPPASAGAVLRLSPSGKSRLVGQLSGQIDMIWLATGVYSVPADSGARAPVTGGGPPPADTVTR